MAFKRATDFKRTLRRFLGTLIEHQRHAIAGRDLYDAVGSFRLLELLGQANDLVEFFNPGVLFINPELRVTDNVDEENMRDL